MANRNDKLESHSAKEKFPQIDKLSANSSLHWSLSGPSSEVESENHPTQPKQPRPRRNILEHPCAQHLWAFRLATLMAKAMGLDVCSGEFPQTMRQ